MPKQKAIEDRFEGLAADALEDLIEDVEKREQVEVIALEVELTPEGDHIGVAVGQRARPSRMAAGATCIPAGVRQTGEFDHRNNETSA